MIDKAKLLDALDTGLRRALPVVRAAERVAPLVGPSRALAGVTAVVGMLADWRGVERLKPAEPDSLDGDCRAIDAILRAASSAGVGRVVEEPHPGHLVREYEGCRWGVTDHWRVGPHGDPAPLLRAVWEHVGPAISVLHLRERGGRIQLRRDTLGAALSSPRAAQIADRAAWGTGLGWPLAVVHGLRAFAPQVGQSRVMCASGHRSRAACAQGPEPAAGTRMRSTSAGPPSRSSPCASSIQRSSGCRSCKARS